MKIIDLRSDTVTLPTQEMREAILHAQLGDDIYDEDPTVNHLQKRVAELTGKEASLFVATGTMGNLTSLLTHCQRGDEAIIGDASHIALWEQCGASTLGGVALRMIPNLKDGRLALEAIESAINPNNIHSARTKLICIENTWNGHPLKTSYVHSVRQLADKHNLKIHLDGARIFNASTALNLSVKELAKDVDSVNFCFSKGLAAPAGSIICGDKSFILEAKRIRKVLGGAMRQVGVLAAACLVSLDKMADRLGEDHENAHRLAEGLASIPGIVVDANDTHTNMVFFDSAISDLPRASLVEKLKDSGILLGIEQRLGIRAVTHYGVTAVDIEEAIQRVQDVVRAQKLAAKV